MDSADKGLDLHRGLVVLRIVVVVRKMYLNIDRVGELIETVGRCNLNSTITSSMIFEMQQIHRPNIIISHNLFRSELSTKISYFVLDYIERMDRQ